MRIYVKSEIYRHVSRCGFRVETRPPVRFWVPVALKNVFTPPPTSWWKPNSAGSWCCRRSRRLH